MITWLLFHSIGKRYDFNSNINVYPAEIAYATHPDVYCCAENTDKFKGEVAKAYV